MAVGLGYRRSGELPDSLILESLVESPKAGGEKKTRRLTPATRQRNYRPATGSVRVGPPFRVPRRLIRVMVKRSENVALESASRSSMKNQ